MTQLPVHCTFPTLIYLAIEQQLELSAAQGIHGTFAYVTTLDIHDQPCKVGIIGKIPKDKVTHPRLHGITGWKPGLPDSKAHVLDMTVC